MAEYKIHENVRVFEHVYDNLGRYGFDDYAESSETQWKLKHFLECGNDETAEVGVVDDPDGCDGHLYSAMAGRWDCVSLDEEPDGAPMLRLLGHEDEMRLGLDFANGWKSVFDLHNGNPKWISEYCDMREFQETHFAFPRYCDNMNIMRYRVLGDCIDSLLDDIKRYYACRLAGGDWEAAVESECLLGRAMVAESPERLPGGELARFKKTELLFGCFSSFEEYVSGMKLGCYMLDGKSRIRDLHAGSGEYNRASYAEPPGMSADYWRNLMELIRSEGTRLPSLD